MRRTYNTRWLFLWYFLTEMSSSRVQMHVHKNMYQLWDTPKTSLHWFYFSLLLHSLVSECNIYIYQLSSLSLTLCLVSLDLLFDLSLHVQFLFYSHGVSHPLIHAYMYYILLPLYPSSTLLIFIFMFSLALSHFCFFFDMNSLPSFPHICKFLFSNII